MQSQRTTPERIILGIDPGTQVMGYAILRVCAGRTEMMAMGTIDLKRQPDAYLRLGHIFERVTHIIDTFHPDELAIEAPFFGKNVQSMLKLGRAQGVAIAAAIRRQVPITEYEPRKIKVAITGNGAASKQQVADMLRRILHISPDDMQVQFDATDALGAAYCHFLQQNRPASAADAPRSWKEFANKHSDRIH